MPKTSTRVRQAMPPSFVSQQHPIGRTAASKVNPLRTIALWTVLSFGFFLQFNIATATLGLRFLRLTDGLLFAYTPYLFLLVGVGATLRYGVPYFVILFGIIFATLLLKTEVEQGDIYLTLIYLLTGVFCFYFVMIAREEQFLVYFAVGTVLGLIPTLFVLYLQARGDKSLPAMGLGVPLEGLAFRDALFAKAKLGGIWIHGNEAGHVYALAGASALYLALRFRRPLIYIAVYGLLLASFAATLNRAGLIAPTFALIYCYARLGDYIFYVKTAIIAFFVVLILALATNLPGLDAFSDTLQRRFLADAHASSNVAQRFESNITGIEIALEHPFGIGLQARYSLMTHQTADGVESVHNGFLSLAYQSGILISLLYIASGLYLLVQRRSVQSFYVIMFLFTATSMMFEELSINQFFIFSVALTIAAAWINYDGRLKPERARFRRREA
jgi:hypothetical protein